MNFPKLKSMVAFQQRAGDFFPKFRVGDTVKVAWEVRDSKKTRIQIFQGIVIAIKGLLNSKNFQVRKSSSEYSIEKTFFYNSPLLKKVELVVQGKVRQSRIYYIRKLKGKSARIKRLASVSSNKSPN